MLTESVVVLGASTNSDRYSNKAVNLLIENGYRVFPVNPHEESICGLANYKTLYEIVDKINTVTVYVNPARLNDYTDAIIKLAPQRVIMNPGTENDSVKSRLEESGIKVITACTLVMLKTGQF